MSAIRILADDLTGALDSVAAFGAGIPVYIDRPALNVGATVPYAAAVATETRDVPEGELPRLLDASIPWLKGATLAFKKVDSLLRGNTFAEVAWVARAGGFRQIVFAPAFPAQGRLTFNGCHWIAPRDPQTDKFVQVGAVPVVEHFARFGLVAGAPQEGQPDGIRVWIPDVRNDLDMACVAAAFDGQASQGWLWCGSGGLAAALADRDRAVAVGQPVGADRHRGPCVLISASFQASLRQQWRLLRDSFEDPIIAECARQDELLKALAALRVRADFAMFDLSPAERVTPAQAAALLRQQVATLVAELPKPGVLVVIGGDTLLGLCRATGARGLIAGTPLRGGWGCACIDGGIWDGVTCHSRSGAFGAPDDLLTMVQMMNIGAHFHKDV